MKDESNVVPTGIQHLLLIGDTKMGKTDYCAQAAIDGYQLFYLDKDNGYATLVEALKSHPEALDRIHYFSPVDMVDFVNDLLTSVIFRYNPNTGKAPNFSTKPDERIIEIRPARFPRGLIVVMDSWTAYANALMESKADKAGIDLTDVEKFDRKVYGPAGFEATRTATALQQARFHLIVQSHPDIYERKEKPEDRTASAIEEKDMIIRETKEIPISTSKPHGATLGKYFNQIGWLVVNKANQRLLDFRVLEGRVGGGTPNSIGDPRGSHRFSKLFGPPQEYPPVESWMEEISYEESLKRAQAATSAKMGIAKPAAPVTQQVPPATPVTITPKSPIAGLKITS
jgi:hypothetical protein